jgi:alkanesulfonate monooxygenase SsuD/methylene tetrahydromethanopterin reductase-like flavin-dependent oxidoreductase (luciferase family)
MKRIWTDDVVEFKGKYYSIPVSKVEPKPVQQPSIPIYLRGPLEYIENSIKSIKEQANRAGKNPDGFRTIILTYPNVIEGQSSKKDENRFPFSGSIDEIGGDIRRTKSMGVDHIVFGYNFVQIGRDVNKMIDVSKTAFGFCQISNY